MKFYISQVPHEHLDMFGTDELFEADGEFWYHCVEFGTNPGGLEDLVIYDTAGRSMPVSVDSIQDLQNVLSTILDKLDIIKAGEATLDEVMEQDTEVFGSDYDFFPAFSR